MYDNSQIIIAPIVTEKSTGLRVSDVYTFRVLEDANKDQIRKAVEELFNVSVVSINTSKVRGKSRILGRSIGKTSAWKKAYVRIKKGQKIAMLEEMK